MFEAIDCQSRFRLDRHFNQLLHLLDGGIGTQCQMAAEEEAVEEDPRQGSRTPAPK